MFASFIEKTHCLLLKYLDTEPPSWQDCRIALEAVKTVVTALVEYIQQHGNRKCQEGVHAAGPGQPKYKVSMCRDLALRGSCPRATNCTFAHSDLELDKYRSKNRKLSLRSNQSPLAPNTETKTEKSIAVVPPSSKGFKQCDDINYSSGKRHDNNQRESNYFQRDTSMPAARSFFFRFLHSARLFIFFHHSTDFNPIGKIEQLQHQNMNYENLPDPMTNYVLPSSQALGHGIPSKNVDLQCSHYIMHGAPLDFANPNLHVWDPSQVPPINKNGLPNNGKKVPAIFFPPLTSLTDSN